MRKLRGTRPSPAMVVAVIALVAALAGTAWAAKRINGGSIIKQSIGGGKLKKNTLSGFQIKSSKLGTVPAARRATHTYWAVVNNPSGAGNATLARSSDAGIGVAETGGRVVVSFPASVGACANVAGKNNTSSTVPGTGYAQTNVAPANSAALEVRTFNETGAAVDGDFHLIMICP
jgi:hypothetical protein